MSDQEEKRLSDAKCWAIEQVLTCNADLVRLLAERGVTTEDIQALCSQAMSSGSAWRRKDA